MTTDVYQEWASRTGLTREEAKKDLYKSIYTGSPESPQNVFLTEMLKSKPSVVPDFEPRTILRNVGIQSQALAYALVFHTQSDRDLFTLFAMRKHP